MDTVALSPYSCAALWSSVSACSGISQAELLKRFCPACLVPVIQQAIADSQEQISEVRTEVAGTLPRLQKLLPRAHWPAKLVGTDMDGQDRFAGQIGTYVVTIAAFPTPLPENWRVQLAPKRGKERVVEKIRIPTSQVQLLRIGDYPSPVVGYTLPGGDVVRFTQYDWLHMEPWQLLHVARELSGRGEPWGRDYDYVIIPNARARRCTNVPWLSGLGGIEAFERVSIGLTNVGPPAAVNGGTSWATESCLFWRRRPGVRRPLFVWYFRR